MVQHVHIQSNMVIYFIIHVCKANLVDFMTQPLYFYKKSLILYVFLKKSSHADNVVKKFFKMGFLRQSHSLKFQRVGRYDRVGRIMEVGTFYFLLASH